MEEDVIKIEILADGTLKSTTDVVSQANHLSCTRFFQYMQEIAGGQQTAEKRSDKHTHTHHHHEHHQEQKH